MKIPGKKYLFTVLVVVCFAIPANAETLLFHIKTALNKDDAQICVAPNIALAALEAGHQVTLLFDASAVTSITKGWGWFNWGSSTPLDKAALPERERDSLAKQLNLDLDTVPHNYGEYILFLKKRGAHVYVNRTMLTLYNIDLDKVDSVAVPIILKEILNLFRTADRIIVY